MSASEVNIQDSLNRALTGQSAMNYNAIFDGLMEKGIAGDDIKPRENVFTFNAWKALGRVVRKGEHGVKVVSFVPCSKPDKETGEKISFTRPVTTTVFHISQTEAIQ